jgi:hypothetical protein
VGPLEPSTPLRLVDPESARLLTASRMSTMTSPPRPPPEPAELGLAGAAPSTPLVGSWMRRPLPSRGLHRPPPLLTPPPPRRLPRPPPTPGRSTPQWAPRRGAHREGPPDRSRRHTATRHRRPRHCCRRSPPRLSRRETPRGEARRGSASIDAFSAPPAPWPCGSSASWRRPSPSFVGTPRGVEHPGQANLPEAAAASPSPPISPIHIPRLNQ